MARQAWRATFKRDGLVYTAASVSIYLAGTTTAVRCWSTKTSTSVLDSAPQFTTDDDGKVTVWVDPDDHFSGQLFDIKCEPRKSCAIYDGKEDILLYNMQILQDTEGGRTFKQTFFQDDPPVDGENGVTLHENDQFVDADDNNHPYVYDGTDFVSSRDGSIATAGTTADWSGIVDDDGNKPADNADITDYTDYRVSNSQIENSVTRIARPQGGTYSSYGNPDTGVIKVTLPQSWTSTMMRFAVDVFNYDNEKSLTAWIGGYNYTGSTWNREFAQIIGNTAGDNRVRFGHDGTKCCILIGETTSTWYYPKIAVHSFQAGYSNYAVAQWETGWSVSIVSSLTGITVDHDFSDALLDAKSIKDQGALATTSSADWSTQVGGTGKPDDDADVTGSNTADDVRYVTGGTLATYAQTPAADDYRVYGTQDVYGDLKIHDGGDVYFYNSSGTQIGVMYNKAGMLGIGSTNSASIEIDADNGLILESSATYMDLKSYNDIRLTNTYVSSNRYFYPHSGGWILGKSTNRFSGLYTTGVNSSGGISCTSVSCSSISNSGNVTADHRYFNGTGYDIGGSTNRVDDLHVTDIYTVGGWQIASVSGGMGWYLSGTQKMSLTSGGSLFIAGTLTESHTF